MSKKRDPFGWRLQHLDTARMLRTLPPGGDYIAKIGTLTLSPTSGETTKTITIEVKGDSKKEANETFYLDLLGFSSNALFTKSRGIGTILNDD